MYAAPISGRITTKRRDLPSAMAEDAAAIEDKVLQKHRETGAERNLKRFRVKGVHFTFRALPVCVFSFEVL